MGHRRHTEERPYAACADPCVNASSLCVPGDHTLRGIAPCPPVITAHAAAPCATRASIAAWTSIIATMNE